MVVTAQGCFYGTTSGDTLRELTVYNQIGSANDIVNLQTSRANAIYGASDTVTPLSQKTNFAIKY